MDEIFELNTRRKIYEVVLKNQGLHLSKIAELLDMHISLVEYHLLFLEKSGIVYSEKTSGFTRYYTKTGIGDSDKQKLSILRQEIPLRIILYLLKTTNAPHKDILLICDVAPSTLSYHLKKLVKHGIVTMTSYGKERGYAIADKEELIRLLVQYKPYSVLESFQKIWDDLRIE